jgi:glycine cleavage system H protein
MSEVPESIKYSIDHDWVRLEDGGLVMIGITDHAQESLGELVFVEVPEEGQTFARGESCAVVESVKAASDVNAPVSGEVVKINTALEESPELVNQNPYDDGWLICLRPSDPTELDELLDADAYHRLLAESD